MRKINDDRDFQQEKVSRETAKIPWIDLLHFFARGRAILVNPGLDLMEVATLATHDRPAEPEAWISEERMAKVSAEQALRWLERDALLWAVVAKPWVFVQEVNQSSSRPLH